MIEKAQLQLTENEKFYYLELYTKVKNILPFSYRISIGLKLLKKYLKKFGINKKDALKVVKAWRELGLVKTIGMPIRKIVFLKKF